MNFTHDCGLLVCGRLISLRFAGFDWSGEVTVSEYSCKRAPLPSAESPPSDQASYTYRWEFLDDLQRLWVVGFEDGDDDVAVSLCLMDGLSRRMTQQRSRVGALMFSICYAAVSLITLI